MKKSFIITIDTEGDNLWKWNKYDSITTENSKYIPRFQNLCEYFGFKPVYLMNFEMLQDEGLVSNLRSWYLAGNCEVGLHLHAWNTPPLFYLHAIYAGNPYLIEYPPNIMEQKLLFLIELFQDKFGFKPYSHRAGRWAINDLYFKMLYKEGLKVDCSVTPGIDWSTQMGETIKGPDYSKINNEIYYNNGVCEIPLSTRHIHHSLYGRTRHRLKTLILGDTIMMRPALQPLVTMKKLIDIISNDSNSSYVQFMIHSSELMPNGSPYFVTAEDVDKLYEKMMAIFNYASNNNFQGNTLKEYHKIITTNNK